MFRVSCFMLRINLLPPQKKKELKLEKINHLVVFYGSLVIISFLLFLILLFNIQLFLSWKISDIKNQITAKETSLENQNDLEEKIKNLNNTLTKITKAQAEQPLWSPTIEKLASLIPSNVQLKNLSGNLESQIINLSGFSPTREKILLLESSLKNSPQFEITNAPLSNLTKPTNIDFQFGLKIKDFIKK